MDLMNTYLALVIPSTMVVAAATNHDQYSFWERIAEKWGIGFVGLGLFVVYAWLNEKKETKRENERKTRENAAQAERVALQQEVVRLQGELLDHLVAHAGKLERLVSEGNTAANNQAMAHKDLIRKLSVNPCHKIERE